MTEYINQYLVSETHEHDDSCEYLEVSSAESYVVRKVYTCGKLIQRQPTADELAAEVYRNGRYND